MGIRLELESNVSEGLKGQHDKLRAALIKGIEAATIGIQADVKQNRLHGGGYPRQITGNLNRNIIALPVEEQGNEIVGVVGIGSSANYGAALEFADQGPYTVPAHSATRRTQSWLTQMSGKARRVRRFASAGTWTVKAHTVQFHTKSFLRSSLEDNFANGKIRAWVEGPLNDAMS